MRLQQVQLVIAILDALLENIRLGGGAKFKAGLDQFELFFGSLDRFFLHADILLGGEVSVVARFDRQDQILLGRDDIQVRTIASSLAAR